MVLHGILSDSRAAGVFCGQSEMPVSSCSGEVCAARAGRRMVWARSLPHSGTAALAYVWAAWGRGSWHRSPASLHTHGVGVIFLYLTITNANTLKKKCYVYLKTFNSYVKTCYVFFWIHIKIHNYQSKQKMLVTITMNILFSHRYLEVLGTKITGMMPVEHTVWYDERSKTWQILGGMHVTPTCRFLF